MIAIETTAGVAYQEFRYNSLGYCTGWHYDVDGDGTVEGTSDDPWLHIAYDDNWRIAMNFRAGDSEPKESIVYHNPGAGFSRPPPPYGCKSDPFEQWRADRTVWGYKDDGCCDDHDTCYGTCDEPSRATIDTGFAILMRHSCDDLPDQSQAQRVLATAGCIRLDSEYRDEG